MQPLAVLLRRTAVSSSAQDTALVQGVCRMLHVLISVRGYKTVVRFFPHEAADLERVLQVIHKLMMVLLALGMDHFLRQDSSCPHRAAAVSLVVLLDGTF